MTFFGPSRISEVVAGGKSDMSLVALQLADVQLTEGKVISHIHKSKAHQSGKGAYVQ